MSYEDLSLDAATFVSVYGITWNVLIAIYVEHEHVEETLKWFIPMSCEELSLDATTFVAVYAIACKLVDSFPLLWRT